MRVIIIFLFSFSSLSVVGQIETTAALIEGMKDRYEDHWFDKFTFDQETIRYSEEDIAIDTAIWHEAVMYPDFFRIDMDKDRQRIFRHDSAYRITGIQIETPVYQPQEFLLMKGGLYHYEKEEVLAKLIAYGYDVDIFRIDTLNGRRAYVIGAESGDLESKQFWIDHEHYYMVRRISPLTRGRTLDLIYRAHIAMGGGWVEQVVEIWVDEKFVQKEKYMNINIDPPISVNTFAPNEAKSTIWYEK